MTNTLIACTKRFKYLLYTCAILFVCNNGFAQKTIPLYTGDIPNALPGADREYPDPASGQLMKVSRPSLTIYLPAPGKATGIAIIICPGGGYGSLVMKREGHDMAKVLTEKGIAAFVLKYRLPDSSTMNNRSIGPLQDAQQAIKIIRQRAKEYNVDSSKIGIMGFSAGGHLAATAGNRFNTPVINNIEGINLRPDFMILIYPIISMDAAIGHKGSTDNLLGSRPEPDLVTYFSNELQVTEKTPPAFIAYGDEDQSVMNGVLFYQALHQHHVSAELHVYAKANHGFLQYPPVTEWWQRCIGWLKAGGWYATRKAG